MFKMFRKPKWETIPARFIEPGDVVSRILIVGPVLSVENRNIQDHDYVYLRIDTTEPGGDHQEAGIYLLANTLVRIIPK
jgi:hypothetical protein